MVEDMGQFQRAVLAGVHQANILAPVLDNMIRN